MAGRTGTSSGLSVFSEVVALTALGLVRPWGEVVPGWIPLIGGRRIPPYAAIVPAHARWVRADRDVDLRPSGTYSVGTSFPFASDGAAALMIGCYAPLYLWGPALLVLTWAYDRRTASGPGAE